MHVGRDWGERVGKNHFFWLHISSFYVHLQEDRKESSQSKAQVENERQPTFIKPRISYDVIAHVMVTEPHGLLLIE